MAASTSHHHLRPLSALALVVISLGALSADPGPSFSFREFAKDAYFESNIAMYGDARVVAAAAGADRRGGPSAGSVVYKRPIKIVQGNPENLNRTSNGTVAVEFDSLKNSVAIDVGGRGPVKVKNVSTLNLVLNSGGKFHSWIDYEAGSRRFEVRVSRSSESRPSDPTLTRFVDLWTMWEEADVFLGLNSSNGNSSQACFIHSWSFKVRHVPQWMHSEPLDPQAVGRNTKNLGAHEKNDCFLKVLAAMIFGTGSGALGAFIVLYLWTIFGNRRPVAPEEFVLEPVDLKKCNKLEVIVDKTVKDVNATK
ncbi:hypothetical protein BT93_D1026 [Corymbia citriodora subsp. variegata]|nr:hypothetical protein BT93_D1026 [Corymbia citriodora subsp. variegata]